MPKVVIDNKGLQVVPGITLLDAALDNHVEIDHNCGGNCACSTCHVIVEEGHGNLSPMREDEDERLAEAHGRTSNSRLACQSQVMGDVKIKIAPKLKL